MVDRPKKLEERVHSIANLYHFQGPKGSRAVFTTKDYLRYTIQLSRDRFFSWKYHVEIKESDKEFFKGRRNTCKNGTIIYFPAPKHPKKYCNISKDPFLCGWKAHSKNVYHGHWQLQSIIGAEYYLSCLPAALPITSSSSSTPIIFLCSENTSDTHLELGLLEMKLILEFGTLLRAG